MTDEIRFAAKPATCGSGLHFRVPSKTLQTTSPPTKTVYEIFAMSQSGEETPHFLNRMAKCGTSRHIKIPTMIEDSFSQAKSYRVTAKRI